MRKLRKDSSRNRLTPEQQVMVENWLFRENLGYAEVLKRIRNELGVEMSLASVGRMYGYFERLRQARQLVEAHVKANPMDKMPVSGEQQRAVAMALTTNAAIHASSGRPGGVKELLPYLRLCLDSERNDLLRRKLSLAERSMDNRATGGHKCAEKGPPGGTE